jgi:hypothetical protein
MRDQFSFRSKLVVCVAALVLSGGAVLLRAAVPTAPTNLAAAVNGLAVTFTFGAAGNSPTGYFLQAGLGPGQTQFEFPIGLTTTFPAAGPAGTYYVRVVAANAEGRGAPSNEVAVTLTSSGGGGGCLPPGAPLNLRAIIRGGEAFIFWRRPAQGDVSNYNVLVGLASGQTFTQVTTGTTTLNTTQSSGNYFLRVVANNACGASAASNEIQISFPSNTVRVADPAPGTSLGMPDVSALIARIHAENPGLVNQSCPTGRKYENNPWQDRIVDRLRQYDTRFGYNAKPTRGPADNNGFPVIAAGDEISFFAGGGNGEGSPNVYTFDVLFDHCGTNPQQNVFRDIAPEPSIWTSAGRFGGS